MPDDLFKKESGTVRPKMKQTQTQYQLFHFKVMELKTYTDTKVKNECNLLFHFEHHMIKPHTDRQLKGQAWDINEHPYQKLILSEDTEQMMEVINHFVATVYYRVDESEPGATGHDAKRVKWEPKFKIRRFPTILAQLTSYNYLFSPNFKWQIDFEYAENQFVIRHTEDQ